MLIQGKVEYRCKSLNSKSPLKKVLRERTEKEIKNPVTMFTFLLHYLFMPWFWSFSIIPLPFMNCSLTWGLGLNNIITANILATLIVVVFVGKIIESLDHVFLNKPYRSYQIIYWFFDLWGSHSLVGNFSSRNGLGSPVQQYVPCQAALPSTFT